MLNMRGLEKLDAMVFHVIESVATSKDIKAEDIEYAARDLYPQHAKLIVLVIKNKPEFMELWGTKPTVEEMYQAVIETLSKEYTEKQLADVAKQLFPKDWMKIVEVEKKSHFTGES